MKEPQNRTGILLAILIIVIGIIMMFVKGFNFDLRYQDAKRVEFNIGKEIESSEMEKLAEEILGKEVVIQKVEVYEDAVSILTKDISDEQKENLVAKINEKYGTEITADETEIITVPHIRLRDWVKPYVLPFSIATIVILVYIAIRYFKLNSLKAIGKTILIVALAQALLFSIIAITRIPIGRLTIPMILTVYMLSLVYCTTKFEKQLTEKIETEESKG